MDHPDKTTEELIREIKQGLNVEENFRQLYERHYAQIFVFFRRKEFLPEDAHDLTQETLFSVYRGLKDLRDATLFKSWVFSIARNTARSKHEQDNAKKRIPKPVSIDQQPAGESEDSPPLAARISDPADDPLKSLLKQERQEKLFEAVQQLSEQKRLCTQMRVVNDMQYQEIADLMGISVNTVKAHLNQAKDDLRKKLGEHFKDIDF